MRLTNGPVEPEFVTIPRHKKSPPAGKKSQLRTSVSSWALGLEDWPCAWQASAGTGLALARLQAGRRESVLTAKRGLGAVLKAG